MSESNNTGVATESTTESIIEPVTEHIVEPVTEHIVEPIAELDSSARDEPESSSDRLTPPLNPKAMSPARRRSLKSGAHHLKPVVQIGQAGITPGVIEATRTALSQHELIKISINGESPTDRKIGATELGLATGAHIIQVIGRVLVLYRKAEKAKPRVERHVKDQKRGTRQDTKRGGTRDKKGASTRGARRAQ